VFDPGGVGAGTKTICFDLPFTPKNVMATLTTVNQERVAANLDVPVFPSTPCPAPYTDAEVIVDATSVNQQPSGVYVLFQ
jgi:hypothetical protein